jgi:hypothetical protein
MPVYPYPLVYKQRLRCFCTSRESLPLLDGLTDGARDADYGPIMTKDFVRQQADSYLSRDFDEPAAFSARVPRWHYLVALYDRLRPISERR